MRYIKFTGITDLDTVDSTNAFLKQHIADLDDGSVVFAREQTKGKGRLGRNWHGGKDKSIFVSFLIKNIYDNIDAIRLSFTFSIALKDFFSKYIAYNKISLKWPNDILVNGKKISGILSEYSKECVIVGAGINVFHFIPDGEIEQPWTTMEAESDINFDIDQLKTDLIDSVNGVFSRYCTNPFSDMPMIWFRESEMRDRNVTVSTGKTNFCGRVKMIDDRGALSIEEEATGETKTVFYGDITSNDQF